MGNFFKEFSEVQEYVYWIALNHMLFTFLNNSNRLVKHYFHLQKSHAGSSSVSFVLQCFIILALIMFPTSFPGTEVWVIGL